MKSLTNLVSASVIATVTLAWCAGQPAKADVPTTVLSQGPVGYWRLNETVQPPSSPPPAADTGSLGATGDGLYLFGPKRGEPGALSGSSATSARFFNPDFDPGLGGSKVEVPFNATLNPSGPFSVEFWAKPSSLVADVFCMAASMNADPAIGVGTNANPRAGWLFYQNGSGTNTTANQWQFRLGNATAYLDGDALRGGTVTAGAWHHIVGTYDGSKASLYVNGVQVASRAISGYQANDVRPFRIGTSCFDGYLGAPGTFAGNRGFDGWLEEVAFYGAALSANDIAAHYNAAKTNGTGYATVVLANHPIGYWRLGEAGNPPAVNLGNLGAEANGYYVYSARPGQAGPQSPAYPGFESDNRACGLDGTNGFVDLPPLNLNTNTVTMTAWILAAAIQTNNAGIVFSRTGTTVAGLKFDASDPNGLSYNWNNDTIASNFKSGLTVPVSQWCFVALIVQPDQATLCLQDGKQFSTAINFANHPEQAFEGETLIGTDVEDSNLTFNGTIDEVAIFNRALSVGEVYSQYASAIGSLKPTLFGNLLTPPGAVYLGDTLTLTVDAGGTPPLNYQWRKDGAPIPGATASTFAKANVDASDSGNYDVVISNAQGSVQSQQANVAVQPLFQPDISQSPQSRTIYKGGLLNLTVQASGGGLTYRWQKNGTSVVGATNASYSVTSASGDDSGTYQVLVANRLGTAQSAVATVTVIVPPAGSYEDVISGDNPESWWRLGDPVGSITLTDAMGRHDGVYKGGVTLAVPGVLVSDSNTAVSFNGTSGYAEVPFTKALNTANFTIECWVKADSLARALCPVASFTQPPGRGYLVQKSEDGLWYYMFGDGVDNPILVVDGSDAIYGAWTHLILTFDGSNFKAYLNGKLDALANVAIVPNNIAPFRIGFDQPKNGWNDFWSGEIDEVAFYQKALTAGQIAAHYAAALYGTQSKPVFVEQPQSSTSVEGSQYFLIPVVEGTLPIHLQWSKNGVPLAGKTNSVLRFNDVSFADTGVYELTATNANGISTSAPAILTVLPPLAFANVTNGLVLHLGFDGSYVDSSGHTNNAQAVGSPTFVKGRIGKQALHFSTAVDASDPNNPFVTSANYVTLGSPPDLQFSSNVNFSVSYWVRLTNSLGDLPFLCNSINSFGNPGYTFASSYQRGGWSWNLGDVASASSIGIYGDDDSINDGSWHHLVHTFDRSGSGITYLDGNQVDSRSVVPAGDLDSGESTTIGQDASGAYPEAGEVDIDDVGMWRRVLTPFEVYSIYVVGQAGQSFDTYGPVSLIINSDAGNVQVVWQAGVLIEATDLSGPWSPVAGAAPPYYKVIPGAVRKFYRVRL
ncbi:MAG: immunoglobulin domain-containing protein [Verrucomicrobia bacterium]|nr:immunoglobulin domain-containing protein [Verrucomicrobiota bacterium]